MPIVPTMIWLEIWPISPPRLTLLYTAHPSVGNDHSLFCVKAFCSGWETSSQGAWGEVGDKTVLRIWRIAAEEESQMRPQIYKSVWKGKLKSLKFHEMEQRLFNVHWKRKSGGFVENLTKSVDIAMGLCAQLMWRRKKHWKRALGELWFWIQEQQRAPEGVLLRKSVVDAVSSYPATAALTAWSQRALPKQVGWRIQPEENIRTFIVIAFHAKLILKLWSNTVWGGGSSCKENPQLLVATFLLSSRVVGFNHLLPAAIKSSSSLKSFHFLLVQKVLSNCWPVWFHQLCATLSNWISRFSSVHAACLGSAILQQLNQIIKGLSDICQLWLQQLSGNWAKWQFFPNLTLVQKKP